MLEPRPLRPPLFDLIVELGLDAPSFRERLAVDEWHQLPGPDQRSRLEDVLSAAVTALGSRSFPLAAGMRVQLADLSALGVVAKAAPTVGAAFARIMQYHNIWVRCLPISLSRVGDRIRFELAPPHPPHQPSPGSAYCTEFAFAGLLQQMRELADQRLRALSVEFIHAGPDAPAELESFFDAPIRFGSPRDVIEFDAEVLDLPVRTADAGLSEIIVDYLDSLSRIQPQVTDSLAKRVEYHVARLIGSARPPDLKSISKAMAVGERTLQRRLHDEEALSFTAIVGRVQRRLAEQLLLRSSKSVDEISAETGFSSASAFIRAFQRWTGETPRQFRIEFSGELEPSRR